MLIEKNGYTAEQMFNADETGLLWKRMQVVQLYSKKIFCGNTNGSYKCKSLNLI